MPRFASWDPFNDYLEEQCRKRQADILRSHKNSIGERMQVDLGAMLSLPAAPFEACDLRSGQVTSTSVVRYRSNDYSVPVAFGQGVLAEAQGAILPLVPYLDTLRWVFIAVALAGVAVTIYARFDDWRRGGNPPRK